MPGKKIKLILLVIIGLFVFGVGYIFAQKYQKENQNQPVFNFQTALDSDNDGLLDSQEKELGTNPYLKDTDGDGFDDKTEIESNHNPRKVESDKLIDKDNDGLIGEDEEKYNTDPNNEDTDFDGYLDGQEIAQGFDPKSADLSNLKNIISQAPEENKQKAKELTNLDLTSESSIDSLQNILSSEQGETIQQYLDQIFDNSEQQDLQIKKISDSEIKISSNQANQENVQEYFNQIMASIYYDLDFLFDQKKLDDSISDKSYEKTAQKITDSFIKSANKIKEVQIPNNNDFIDLHKKILTNFYAVNTNYQLIFNSQDPNMSTQALKNILLINKIIYQEIFPKITQLAQEYNIINFIF